MEEERINEEALNEEAPISGKQDDTRHKLLDRVVISFFLMIIAGLIFVNLGDIIIDKPLGAFLEGRGHHNYGTGVGAAVGALLWLLMFRLKFRKEGYQGQLGFGNFFKGMGIVLSAIVICGFLNIGDAVMNGHSDILVSLLCALAPGFSEEIVLRGPGLSNMMRKAGGEKDLLLAWWLPAVTFGLMHSANILAGASFSATVLQVVYATGIGLIYGAAVLRTGTLWPSIVAHYLTDFAAYLGKTVYESQGVLNMEIGRTEFTVTMIISVLFILIGLFLMRKSKRPEAMAVWAEKWNRNGVSTL